MSRTPERGMPVSVASRRRRLTSAQHDAARSVPLRSAIDYVADRADSGRMSGDSRQPLSNRRRWPGGACTMRESAGVRAGAGRSRREHGKLPGYSGISPSRIAVERRSAVRP
ncbi:hypothetical protein WS61_22535 [Burkholderia sp. ABCPW 11]|nr:hypothetical protein WS61_22535 [Burkholderia sp. ABCPW 11]